MFRPLLAAVSVAILLSTSQCVVAISRGVTIELTYPSGQSPKVFTTGWLFGAKAMVDGKDVSNTVQWSGTGTFAPAKGNISRPSFNKPGTNTITLSVEYAGKRVSKQFTVTAVSSDGYAAVGDPVSCHMCIHGCPGCPHYGIRGWINRGSPNVLVGGKPAARKGDGGTHAACCGTNLFEIMEGDPKVLIDGKPAARKGDKTRHCGGDGRIEGTPPKPDLNKVTPRRGASNLPSTADSR